MESRPHGSTVPGEPSAHDLPGHIYEPSPSSGLEETSRSPAQHVGRSSEKERGHTNINSLDLSDGPTVVGT